MKRWIVVLAVILVPAASGSAVAAQDSPLRWHFSTNYSPVSGDYDDVVDDGWGLDFGGTWRPDPGLPVGLRFDMSYDWWDLKTGNLPDHKIRIDSGTASSWALRIGAQFEGTKVRKANFYGGVGIGGYRLYADVRQTVLYNGIYCDPYWGWCYSGVTAGDAIVDSDSSFNFGYYVNAGVEFPLGPGGLFVEADYNWVDADMSFEYFPIAIGYRW